jgi:hypothetical protein
MRRMSFTQELKAMAQHGPAKGRRPGAAGGTGGPLLDRSRSSPHWRGTAGPTSPATTPARTIW